MRKLARMTQGESSRARASVPSRLRATRLVTTLLLATLLVSAPVLAPGAQATQPPARGAIRANGEELAYLRALSLLDTLRDASMLIQPFSATGDLTISDSCTSQAQQRGPSGIQSGGNLFIMPLFSFRTSCAPGP